jgi:hypothetical protein
VTPVITVMTELLIFTFAEFIFSVVYILIYLQPPFVLHSYPIALLQL